jgi:hypothetical protein
MKKPNFNLNMNIVARSIKAIGYFIVKTYTDLIAKHGIEAGVVLQASMFVLPIGILNYLKQKFKELKLGLYNIEIRKIGIKLINLFLIICAYFIVKNKIFVSSILIILYKTTISIVLNHLLWLIAVVFLIIYGFTHLYIKHRLIDRLKPSFKILWKEY